MVSVNYNTLTVISFMPNEQSFNYVYILFGCLIPNFFI